MNAIEAANGNAESMISPLCTVQDMQIWYTKINPFSRQGEAVLLQDFNIMRCTAAVLSAFFKCIFDQGKVISTAELDLEG